jgi:hypothetical protein
LVTIIRTESILSTTQRDFYYNSNYSRESNYSSRSYYEINRFDFDTVEIRDYLEECRVNEDKFTSTHLVGDLVIKEREKLSSN